MEKNGNKLGKRKEIELQGPQRSQNPSPQGASSIVEHHQVVEQVQFVGPIPEPSVLQGYENIKAGFAERIVAMAERQAAHRQQIEVSISKAHIDDSVAERIERKRGQVIGAIVVIVAVIASVILGISGNGPWSNASAAAIGGIPLVGLVIAFISGKKTEKEQPPK